MLHRTKMHAGARTVLTRFLVLVLVCAAASAGDSRSPTIAIESCPRDSSGFQRVQKLADENDAQAQATLADCYEQGRNVSPDGKRAIHWLTLSAQQGFVPAEYELGRTYLYGRGIPADYKQAVLWEEKAAAAGHLNAQRDMALIYERGFGVTSDPARAAFWNRKAAEQGDTQAQLHLANALYSGSGVQRDARQAFEWYLKAATQGVPEAELRIAEIYDQRGAGSCASALMWYGKAARSGLTEAMYRTGRIYQQGKCGHQSMQSAYTWFEIGARHGSPECKLAVTKLGSTLTQTQMLRAKQAADLWIKRNSTAAKDEDEEEGEKH
jgi:uncharacterized protein